MKKQIALFTILSTLATSIFALETGGIFKNNFTTTTTDFKEIVIPEYASTYLWLSTPINEDINFSTEIMYKFGYNTYNQKFTNILDLDLLILSGKVQNFSYNVGRFSIADTTGAVLSQNLDAIQLKYDFSSVQLDFVTGYTGLLNGKNVYMQDSNAEPYFVDDYVYALANPFIVLDLSANLNFAAQNLKIETLGFLDFGDDKTNRFFANVGLSGFITPKFAYNFATSFGTLNFSQLMNFTKLNFDVYPNKNIILSLGTEYASGNQGPFKSFAGVTSRLVGSDALSLFTKDELSVKLKMDYLLNSMIISGNVNAIFTCPESFDFSGVDSSISWIYQIFTDLQVSAKVFGFFDTQNSGDNNKYGVTLDVALSF